jgi:parvulin-like peptidyl-prolyl isomerase
MPRKIAKSLADKKTNSIRSVRPITTSKMSQLASQTPKMQEMSFGKKAQNPRFYIPAIIIVLAILAYVFRGYFIVAIVNGQPISKMAFTQALEKQNGKTVLSGLITQVLINQEASKNHVTVSSADIDQAVKDIEKSLASQGGNLDRALAQRGMTKSEFLDQLKTQKLVEKLLAKDISVSDQEISSYIDKNKDTLPQGLSDADLKSQVKQQLQQQKLTTKFQQWMQNLQSKAKIQQFVNF